MLFHDHYHTVGASHQVCKDYIIKGNIPNPYLVLSDGCTGSENTEIGARILTLATKTLMENALQWPWDYFFFGQKLIGKAWEITEELQLPGSVLNATVMLAFLYEDCILVYIYGDGCVLLKDHSGRIGTIEVVFSHNAPYYLTYWHDQERRRQYAKYEPNPLVVNDSIHGSSPPKPYQTPLAFCFSFEKFQSIAIASDGISQCIDTATRFRLPLSEVACHFLDFPYLSPEFAAPHMESILNRYAKRGVYPADDLSIGIFAKQLY